jgi:photosystem II stability/assembly factor-like uncharacterized protein
MSLDGGSASGSSSGTVPGSWDASAGNLTGLPSICGNLGYLSSKPDTDMLIAGVANHGLWSSTNGSMQYSQLGQGAGSDMVTNRTSQIIYDPMQPSVWYQAGAYGPCAYRTTDNGSTFHEIMPGATLCDSISVDFNDPARKTILSGGHERHFLFRSTDSGNTYTDISANVPMEAGQTGFAYVLSPTEFLLGTWGGMTSGVWRSSDGGSTWTNAFSGDDIRAVPLLASDGGIYWVLNNSNAGMIVSRDKGVTWQKVAGSESLVSTQQALVELPDGRFVGVGPDSLIISADHGASWKRVTPTLPYQPPSGFLYSTFRKAFYLWHFDCFQDANPVLANDIVYFDFDYTSM